MRTVNTNRRASRPLKVKLLATTMLISMSLLGTSPALESEQSFLESRQTLERQIANTEGDEQAYARLQLMKLYMEHSFYREAYALAAGTADTPQAMTHPDDQEMAKTAFILARLPDSEDILGARSFTLADPAKEILWQLVHAAHSGKAIPGDIEPAKALPSLHSVAEYSTAIQQHVALTLINAAFDAGDGIFARALITHLPSAALATFPRDCQTWVSGRLAELENYPRTALDRYKEIKGPDGQCAAMAIQRRIALSLERGILSPQESLTALENLLQDWKGDQVERDALILAAHTAYSLNDKDKALAYLEKLHKRFPESFEDERIREKAHHLALERLTIEKDSTPEELRSDRATFRPFISAGLDLFQADMAYARMMFTAGRYHEARETYEALLGDLAGDTRGATLAAKRDLIAALARTWLKLGDTAKAQEILASALKDRDPTTWESLLRDAYLDVAIARHEIDAARKILGATITDRERRQLADAALRQDQVQTAFDLTREIFFAGENITIEDCDRLATAALLLGEENEANRILAPHRNIWGGSARIAAIAFTSAPEAETDNISPESRMSAILEASDDLITLVSELATVP